MIVITTPTGAIGHQVLEHVVRSAEHVRVIVRAPSKLSPAARERFDVDLKVCHELGIRSVWIDRLGEALNPDWTPDAVLSDLAGLPELLA